MKSRRYISFAMLLLFVAAFLCRLSAGYSCSCGEHHHAEVHQCCGCAQHAAQCANHDFSYKERSCNLHYSVDDIVAQVLPNDSKNHRLNHSISLHDAMIACFHFALGDMESSRDKNNFDNYSFSSLQWSSAPNSLRAPPVLV